LFGVIMKSTGKRNFLLFLVLFLTVIATGLFSRSQFIDRSSFLGKYSGDTLWGLMVFLGFCILFSKVETPIVALVSVIFSFSIEFSQLVQVDWLNELRQIKPVGLVLGYGFMWSDLLCYSIGIAFGCFLDLVLSSRREDKSLK